MKNYSHLFVIGLIYTAIVCVLNAAGFVIQKTVGLDAAVYVFEPILPIVLVSIQLVAVWTALAQPAFWRRALFSICILFTFWIAPTVVVAIAHELNHGDTDFRTMLFLLRWLSVLWIASQVPMWYFRLFHGWQFTMEDSPSPGSVHISDILLLTALFACAVALIFPHGLELSIPNWCLHWSFSWHDISPFLTYYLLITMPAVIMIMRPTVRPSTGLRQYTLYFLVFICLYIVCRSFYYRIFPSLPLVVHNLLQFGLSSVAIAVPLLISRNRGFVLWSSSHEKRKSTDDFVIDPNTVSTDQEPNEPRAQDG